jgi:arylsulfatase A-like enzyme
MSRKPNLLFVMADQLRADYLGCTGHPTIRTPNIERLAARGMTFTRAFAQAPVCCGSRMSFYTGRYAFTHGATGNYMPIRIDERTIADYLRPLGYRTGLVGRSDVWLDEDALAHLGATEGLPTWARLTEGGFEPFGRDEGLHPDPVADPNLTYNQWLRDRGYQAENPWQAFANSAEGDNGEVLSGWHMRNAGRPTRVREEHSETAYTTDRAIDYLSGVGDGPWCLHVSYIKPHWPYLAPAPYHAMYGPDDVIPANRSAGERIDPNPVLAAFMDHRESRAFSREEVRRTVIPTYMGLISQLDQHIGRLIDFIEQKGWLDDTVIVLTSDHGDYLGDHWLGDKEMLHEEAIRIPLVIADPNPACDTTRGSIESRLVEAIDVLPTFIELAGQSDPPDRLEGRSLTPFLRGDPVGKWRDAAFADLDFALRPARAALDLGVREARGFMVRTERWKYMKFIRHPPALFDLYEDPHELIDLGRSPDHERAQRDMDAILLEWLCRRKLSITRTDAEIDKLTGTDEEFGYLIGHW